MTDETTTPAADAPVAAPEAAVTPIKRKLKVVSPQTGFKTYQTTDKHTYTIDIQIQGEVISGQWSKIDGVVEFLVPDHLVEGFEKHYHFVSNNVAAVAE
jgi:hypothetical protein